MAVGTHGRILGSDSERNLGNVIGSDFQTIRALGRARDGRVCMPARPPSPPTTSCPSVVFFLEITDQLCDLMDPSLSLPLPLGISVPLYIPTYTIGTFVHTCIQSWPLPSSSPSVGPARPGPKNLNLRGDAEPYQNGIGTEGKKHGSPI